MPLVIVRNDIVNMQVDAIVNTANPRPVVGTGVDSAIHKKAGPRLLEARKKIGAISRGEVAVTPAFGLDARYVIHAVGPVWRDGTHGEEQLLRQCFDNALEAAAERGCESIAFPLLSAGNYMFPEALALQIAINAFSTFLMEHEMQIYLVVFDRDAFELSEKIFHDVESYIDEHYIAEKTRDEYALNDDWDDRFLELRQCETRWMESFRDREEPEEAPSICYSLKASAPKEEWLRLEDLLAETDAGFSETLLKLIDKTGKKDSEIYKKANVDRKLFSKIRNNPEYKPTKVTAVAFALALELNLEETQDFIGRAGYALSHSSKFDIIIEYFILKKNYNVLEIDAVLFHYDQPTIGSEA